LSKAGLNDGEFELIYKEHAPRVWKMCLAYSENEEQAKDFMQETFIRVWENLPGFRNEAKLSTWIYRITVNTCLAHLRSPKNRAPVEMKDHLELIIDQHDDKEQQVQQLYKAIRQLQETDRLIITMVLEEVTYPEIAQTFNISEGNLRVKIHRIKQELSKIFFSYESI